jgi:hypothetical protein
LLFDTFHYPEGDLSGNSPPTGGTWADFAGDPSIQIVGYKAAPTDSEETASYIPAAFDPSVFAGDWWMEATVQFGGPSGATAEFGIWWADAGEDLYGFELTWLGAALTVDSGVYLSGDFSTRIDPFDVAGVHEIALAYTHSGHGLKLYVDGVLVASGASVPVVGDFTDFAVDLSAFIGPGTPALLQVAVGAGAYPG